MSETKRLTDFFVPPTLNEWLAPWSPAKPVINELVLDMETGTETRLGLFIRLKIEAVEPADRRKIKQAYEQLLPGGQVQFSYWRSGIFSHYTIGISFPRLVLPADALLGAKKCRYSSLSQKLSFTAAPGFTYLIPQGPEVMEWFGVRYLAPMVFLPLVQAKFDVPSFGYSNRIRKNIPLIRYCKSCGQRHMVTGGELGTDDGVSRSIFCIECIQGSLSRAILHCVKDFPTVLIRLCQDHV